MLRIFLLFIIQTVLIAQAGVIPNAVLYDQDALTRVASQPIKPLDPTLVSHASRPRTLPGSSLPKPKPAAGAKPQTKPASPVAKPLFPKLAVPYQDTATNLCELYLDCPEQDDESTDDPTVVRRNPRPIRGGLTKRRTVEAELPNGKIKLTAPDQPRSGILYTGKRKNNDKNVFDFKDDKLGSRIVKNFKTILKPTNEFATEHIIELQTIPLFMEYAVKQDPALDGFFRTEWEKKLPLSSIKIRPHKTSYQLSAQDSLMKLVFEPFGSLANPTHFVLCEAQINLYKERLWSADSALMKPKVYEEALTDGVTGAVPSSVFLSAIRLTFGVYSYLNDPDVMDKMRIINDNIKLELSNAAALTNQPNIDLVPIWNAFIAQHFTKAEDWGTSWLKDRMPKTKAEIQSAMTKYRALYRQLKQKEGSATAAQYAVTQKTKQTQLEKALADQKAVVATAEKLIVTLRASRKGKTAAQKKTITSQMDLEKKKLKNELRKQGLIQRSIHELYSDSVQQILQNLQADNTRVAEYERAIAGLKLTRP